MIQFHVYPQGKRRAVTFGYDDGHKNDERLIALFRKYGMKGTFFLNGGNYLHCTDEEAEALRGLYKGQEVACHTLLHGWCARMPMQSVVTEVFEDRKILEAIFKTPVTGLSYPSGSYNEEVLRTVRACGILYGRTTCSAGRCVLPDDFLAWHPACHHANALPVCEKFLQGIDSEWEQPLLYIWGHSHEFREERDWEKIEEILRMLSGNEKIWYATNLEIYNYTEAQKRLQISADERMFYNPSAIPVWVEKNKQTVLEILPGQTLTLE